MFQSSWKLPRSKPVILLMLGLVLGGCRGVRPVYQDVPSSADTKGAASYADARVFYGGGEVRTPGPKAYLGKTTISTAIQAAGDFTEAANKRKVKLVRSGGRSETIVVVDSREAIHPPSDPPVYPGDRIEVPRKWWH